MHFFGLYGTFAFLIGLDIFIYIVVAKLVDSNFSITNKPVFFIALTAMIIGMQLFLAGFIAELISRNSTERNNYLVEKKLGIAAKD